MRWSTYVGVIGVLAQLTLAAPSELTSAKKRQNCRRRPCKFDSWKTPQCWKNSFNLSTNYYEQWPASTNPPQEYHFEISQLNMAPDGFNRSVVAINGMIPGPLINVTWGDTVVVHVTNKLDNGTSIHFHGVRQFQSNDQDGTSSITQCPIAPGQTMTYTWTATQYGTSWYHSHFGVQAWNGVFGGIQVNGPASSSYHRDMGIIALSDWGHVSAEANYEDHSLNFKTTLDNGLINGKNVFQDPATGKEMGERYEMHFTPGESHRLRLVNTAADTFFKVHLDGHNMTVIAVDFVPVKPWTTDVLPIGHGQRYDVIVNATNPSGGDFWFRAVPAGDCSATHVQQDNIRAIVRYDSTSKTDPTTNPVPDVGFDCNDPPKENLVPIVEVEAGGQVDDDAKYLTWGIDQTDDGYFKWDLNASADTTMFSDWRYPTLQQILNGNGTYTQQQHVIEVKEKNKWTYFILTNMDAVAHPIHQHGHDFFVLDQQENANFDPSTKLSTKGSTRRDVATLPKFGYLVLAIQNDNPGTWLMHCHIAWHAAQGFALQLVERADEIAHFVGADRRAALDDTCKAWKQFQNGRGLNQIGLHESGV